MSDPSRYEIRTVDDFLQVPVERIEACLDEFKTALALGHVAKAVDPRAVMPRFVWIDDGERDIKVNISASLEQLEDA